MPAQLMARLDQLERSRQTSSGCRSLMESMMYLLRNHISVVRNRLAAGKP